MLKKLVKYDILSSKIMIVIYIFAIVLSVVWAIISPLSYVDNTWVYTITNILAVPTYIAALAVIFCPVILSAINFYRKLISDEAYLSFTLPVPRYYHIISKMISNAVWMLSSTIVLIVCLVIVAFGFAFSAQPGESVPSSPTTYDPYILPMLIELFVIYIVSIFTAPLYLFASLSFGQVLMKKNKIVGAVIAYYILNMVLYAATVIITIATLTIINISGTSLSEIQIAAERIPVIVLGIFGLFYTLLSLALFLFTNYCLTKKLNLE